MRKEIINDLRNAVVGFGEILDFAIVYNNLCKLMDNDDEYNSAKTKEFHYWTNDKRYNYTKGKFEKMLTVK